MNNGLYVHIPFCRAKCDYCSFYSVPLGEDLRNSGLMKSYVAALINEIESRSDGVPVDTIFIGGGSPSYLEPDDIRMIFTSLRKSYPILPDAEITVEINPSDLNDEMISALISCGVNRFSLGVQTVNRELYGAIGRKGGFCDKALLDRYFAIPGVQHCVDIIGGLPLQTAAMLLDELETITAYSPDHISLYMLTLEDGSPLSRRFIPDDAFDNAQKEDLASGIHFLRSRGYEHYEISNFALPGRRSRHNMKYWTFQPYYGFGAGAHSFTGGQRFSNKPDIFTYMSGSLPVYDRNGSNLRMAEYIMTSLRLSEGFSTDGFAEFFGEMMPDSVWESAIKLSREGSVIMTEEGRGYRIAVSEKSFFFTDTVIFSMVESLL
jgi:oxygen-independent coproporphyrinogen-3 oxidase